MKTISITLVVLLFNFLISDVFGQIPNSGFENWTASDGHLEPDGWWTANDSIKYNLNLDHLVTVGISDTFTGNGISIYPNPAGEILTIYFLEMVTREIDLNIMNPLGQNVLSQSFIDASNKVDLDISRIPEGLYFVRMIVDNKNIYNERIIIKR